MKFDDLVKITGNEMASLVDDGVAAGDVTNYIDTGSYVLNALLSGSLFGGALGNKVTAFAGESATGKTFFVLGIVKNFLDQNKDAGVIYFESEGALTKDMIVERGIDAKRIAIIPVTTVQEFRHQAIKVLDKYCETPEGERPKLMMCMDSLGNLSTTKELEDATDGKETQDMTRSRLIKGVFRILALKLSKAKVPLFLTNHTYMQVGSMFPQQIMGGGCLVAGTKLVMADNTLKNIEDIKIDDLVNTLNGLQSVSNTFKFDDKEVFELSFDDGSTVRCSGDHKFLVNGEWTSVFDMVEEGKNTESINIDVYDVKDSIYGISKK